MAKRTVAYCDGKYIGIESIYTVINDRQINIPERLKDVRAKSQNNELYCPCGCGSRLILVAGDNNLREQHFRLKDGILNQNCHVITEGKMSVDSKIVLKCWLDDKLQTADIETRVPIHAVENINRKYEFSFLSKEKKIALSYCYDRVNLSDEKFEILGNNGQGIRIIYVVDMKNDGSGGQYPEGLMKIQERQGYCLLLDVVDADYSQAEMTAIFYTKDMVGMWKKVVFAEGKLKDFFIDIDGRVLFDNKTLDSMRREAELSFWQKIEAEKNRRAKEQEWKRQERERLAEEARKVRQLQEEEVKKRRAYFEEKQRMEEERHQEEVRQRDEEFKRNMESNFSQQETQVRDAQGNRWIKCEFCGKIATEDKFVSYGGPGHINLGKCKECAAKKLAVKQKTDEKCAGIKMKYDPNICPECGGTLKEKNGQFGNFMGCSNYPKCRYTRKIRG